MTTTRGEYQINMWQNDGGGWVVEYRWIGDRRWTCVGVYGSRDLAAAAYARTVRG